MIARLAIAATLVAVSATHAGEPKGRSRSSGNLIAVKGEWVDCNTIMESRQDGDDQLIILTISEKFTGTLNGTFEGTERNVVHKDGSASFNSSGLFTGEVNGRSGTAVMTYSGTLDAKGAAVAHWVLDKGTDDLARIDGQGTFQGKQLRFAPAGCTESQSAFSGAYSGRVQFGG
jgi:hypothetical protein